MGGEGVWSTIVVQHRRGAYGCNREEVGVSDEGQCGGVLGVGCVFRLMLEGGGWGKGRMGEG
jgi:hypothetical protein